MTELTPRASNHHGELKYLQAWLSADHQTVSEGLNPEHSTSFEDTVPTLGDLRWVFVAISQVLVRYELFRVCT